ncbi:MAG: HAD-IC family P-type ATPase, partial [Cypionkella sp.]|nr:HAD-IC family P-type ATPase [Cypionkella sp.]
MKANAADLPYWCQDQDALIAALQSGPGGLGSARATRILAEVGPNSVERAVRLSVLRLILRQFESPLVLILVFAAAISLVLQQWVDAGIILAIVVGSSLLSFFQEYRASKAVDELKERLALTARVLRDGVEQLVPVALIVPGDVILLSAGNLIPADGRVIEAQDFLVSQASMTGESFPVEKRPGQVRANAPITERTNTVFMGASVRSGSARVLAVKTSRDTEFGAIAARLGAREPETDFARGVRQFGYLLIRVMVVIVIFVLTVSLLLHRPVIDSMLFAVALAVGLSPELLPAIISVTLSAGARAMSKRGVIVRRLDAIENLGSMTILCTDKTGTLTEGKIVLREVLDGANVASDALRKLAFLNAAFETGIENPLDAAIKEAGEAGGLSTAGYAKIDEIPYDFVRRRLTVVVAPDGAAQHLMVSKGAFAEVLATCTKVEIGGTALPMDAARGAGLEATFKAKSAEGLRVLALATRRFI